jgi:hypothetical protein
VTSLDDRKFRLQAALRGFDEAGQRLRGVATPMSLAGAEEIFIPLCEALWWTVTVDDGFEDLSDGGLGHRPSAGDYRSARNADPSGQVLRALRYARDRCGHHRAFAVVPVPFGVGGPVVRPVAGGGFLYWCPSVDLPQPDPKFGQPKMRAEYDRLLAGRFPAEAIDSAADWFAREQTAAGL